MGDSLVAGNGALEEFAMGTLIEYRGVSWAAGNNRRARPFNFARVSGRVPGAR